MWIFGYGSLIWKVDFPYEEKHAGYVEGYCRRFWQGSTDHRGYPGKPGRVITLSESAEDRLYGVAYRIAEENVAAVMGHLDHREKNGYSRSVKTFHPLLPSVPSFDCQIYAATPENPAYLGPAPVEEMARQIFQSVGPSGPNAEYLFHLATAHRDLFPGVEDEHLFELEEAVRKMQSEHLERHSHFEKVGCGE